MSEKKRFLDRILRFIGIEEDEMAATLEDEAIPSGVKAPSTANIAARRKNRNPDNTVGEPDPQRFKVVVVQPHAFDDIQPIADRVKALEPVVLSLEKAERETARRMIDFISGTMYTLGGDIQRLNENIFFLAPPGVEVDGRFHVPMKEGTE